MRNLTPLSQALATAALTCAICGYEALAVATCVVVIGIEVVVTFALASEDDERQ